MNYVYSTTHPNDNAYPGKNWNDEVNPGISIRAAFAMAAMQGMLADPNCIDSQKVATAAVKMADALIAELNKPSKEVK